MRVRFVMALAAFLLLALTGLGSAWATTFSGSAALHDGSGGTCDGQTNGDPRGSISYVFDDQTNITTVTVNLQGALPNVSYDVFVRCVAFIGTLVTDGAGDGTGTYPAGGQPTSIDLNLTGTSGLGHIGSENMTYTQEASDTPVPTNTPAPTNTPTPVSVPTSANDCKNGGWQAFGTFKNQGDCVSFVATKGKNPPAGP